MRYLLLIPLWFSLVFGLTFPLHAQTLPTPIQVYPANNATGLPTTITLVWQAVPSADQYKVSVGTSLNSGGDVVWDTAYVGTTYTVTLPNGKYFWRIKAKHLNPYFTSEWSANIPFSVGPPPPLSTPNLVSPANGATNQPSVLNLTWQAVSGANQYFVALGNSATGPPNIAYDTSHVGTSFTTPALANGTYYWKIMAKALSPYQTSQWSTVRSFTVGTPLTAPSPIFPTNGSTLQVLGANLTWSTVNSATYYLVKVATDASMTNIVFQDNNIVNATNRVTENLQYNTPYYWTIQAGNASSTSTVSNVRTFTTMPDNPNAVTSHPRLLITPADVTRLQGWAISGNPIFTALQTDLNSAIGAYNSQFFPGGQPNPNWPDLGNTTWSGYVTEQYAEFFAFWSLIDPVVANRKIHAQRARNLLMYVIDHAILGPAANVPFRDPNFMTYDRSRVYGEACPLTVDWIYDAKDVNNNNILTDADKAKIRTVFMRWCNDQLTAYNHPTPVGLSNDKSITLTNRWILNNYFSGHARNMTLMSLCIDAVNDDPIVPNLPYSALGNSLRSYLYNATGAWLYQQYAQFELPEIVSGDYGVSPNGLGMGSGGLSVESSLYGQSIGWVAQECLALKTAGWMDENVIGKQAKLLTSDYWSRLMDGLLHITTPVAKIFPSQSYLGPIYQAANYGDLLRTWIMPEMIDVSAPIGLIDIYFGNNPTRLAKSRWFTRNVLQGGNGLLLNRVTGIWPGSNATAGLYYFMLLDPTVPPPADPRPAMPTTFWDNSFKKILSRTDWTTNATWFNWQCHWTQINHQSGDGNQFEFFRNGEWLTKERSGYTNDGVGYTSEFHNTLGLQNNVPANLQWFEGPTSVRGGQWTNGLNAGDPTVVTSYNSNYVYATGVSTNLYNRPNIYNPANAATDIQHASRSIVWLKPDHIIVYDRATSATANRFKRFFLQFTAFPAISGKNVTVNTPGGQKVYLSNLLPAASVLTSFVSENLNSLAQLEVTTHELKIEDPSNPTDVRFLNVIQGANSGASKDSTILVQSTSGKAYEGAVVKNTAVLFPNVWGGSFTSTSYTIPSTVTTEIVTGLTAGAGYNVTATTNGSNVDVTVSPGNQIMADGGGVIQFNNVPSSNNPTSQRIAAGASEFNMEIAPNPFVEQINISYELPAESLVNFQVMDINGKIIEKILNNETQSAGKHEFVYTNNNLPSGVYICELKAGGKKIIQRVVKQ